MIGLLRKGEVQNVRLINPQDASPTLISYGINGNSGVSVYRYIFGSAPEDTFQAVEVTFEDGAKATGPLINGAFLVDWPEDENTEVRFLHKWKEK